MKLPPSVSAGLQRAEQAFDARPRRERLLLLAAAAAIGCLLVDAAWLTPAFKRWNTSRQQHVAAERQMASLPSHQSCGRWPQPRGQVA